MKQLITTISIIAASFLLYQTANAETDSTWVSLSVNHAYNIPDDMSSDGRNLLGHVKFQSINAEVHRSWYGAGMWYSTLRNTYKSPLDVPFDVYSSVEGYMLGLNGLIRIVSGKWFKLQFDIGLQYVNYTDLYCTTYLYIYYDYYSQYRANDFSTWGYNFRISCDFKVYRQLDISATMQYIESNHYLANDFLTVGLGLKYNIK